MSEMGKKVRLDRIFKNGRAVMVPMDDGLISGPEEGLRHATRKIQEISESRVDAILGFKGLFKRNYHLLSGTPMVMNLTASSFRVTHTRKALVGSVEDALRLGADAVGVHVNVTSVYETEMLTILGEVSKECERMGVPLLALMYPRKEHEGRDENYLELKSNNRKEYAELVRHAARIGVELGADIIKTQYTGDIDSFRTVVESCQNVPIVVAGGPKISASEALMMAYGVISAGGAGICFGRNTYNRSDTKGFILKLQKIVHQGLTPDDLI